MREWHGKSRDTSVYGNYRYHRRWKRITSILAIFVAIGTTSALMLPAITMNRVVCGIEEHDHGPACYQTDGVLFCELTEHTHTDACRDPDALTDDEQAQVDAVIAAIALLPEPAPLEAELAGYVSPSDRGSWEQCHENASTAAADARTAWNSLPENLRSFVTNAEDLISLEKVLAEAVPPMTEEEAAQQQVDEVVALIDVLPTPAELEALLAPEAESSGSELRTAQRRIQTALDAYNALSTQQQAEVLNTATLTELESMLPALQSGAQTPAPADEETSQDYQPVLPATGGYGITPYIISGLLLMAAAAVLLYKNLRMSQREAR